MYAFTIDNRSYESPRPCPNCGHIHRTTNTVWCNPHDTITWYGDNLYREDPLDEFRETMRQYEYAMEAWRRAKAKLVMAPRVSRGRHVVRERPQLHAMQRSLKRIAQRERYHRGRQ